MKIEGLKLTDSKFASVVKDKTISYQLGCKFDPNNEYYISCNQDLGGSEYIFIIN